MPKDQGEALAKAAAEAAQARLREMAHAVLEKLNLSDSRCAEFNKQVGAFLQTSWAVLKSPVADMGKNYETIGRLMAFRCNVRAFDAWPKRRTAA